MTSFSSITHKHRNGVKVDFWPNIAKSEYSQCFTGNLYSWLLNNLELQSTTTTHLLFQDDDYGKYTCIAANALGRDAESMYLYRKCHNIKSTTQTLKYPRTDEYTLTLSLYRIILKMNFRRSHSVWNMGTNSFVAFIVQMLPSRANVYEAAICFIWAHNTTNNRCMPSLVVVN